MRGNYAMSKTQYEKQQIELAYNLGLISQEYRNKLMNDIVPHLWNDLFTNIV